jgi:primosomal protein N' (replication factor Y)
VDEEHDGSLKQDESPRYHARDLALWRAKTEGARIILGSATPSLESIVNAKKGKLVHLFLERRVSKQDALPKITIVDLKERARDVDFRPQDQSKSSGQKLPILSRPLILAMTDTLQKNQQVLLFLNQRGYAKFGVCYQCGHTVACPHCSVGLTYYQRRRMLLCHHCKYTKSATITCENCQQDGVNFLGLGTERLEEEVLASFPDYITLRLDRDIVRSQRRLTDTLTAMHEKRAHILIGTQMIAKGHDFLHVGLVGVVCADVGLSMPDFRAQEKTFQLLTQVAGRAGRGEFAGQAIIQTFHPEHPSIAFAKTHDVKEFINFELSLRKRFCQPPYTRAALIRCEHTDATIAEDVIMLAKKHLASESRLSILGPVPSPIEKISNRFRYQCLIMAKETSVLHRPLERLQKDRNLAAIIAKKRVRFIIDVDPYNLS